MNSAIRDLRQMLQLELGTEEAVAEEAAMTEDRLGGVITMDEDTWEMVAVEVAVAVAATEIQDEGLAAVIHVLDLKGALLLSNLASRNSSW